MMAIDMPWQRLIQNSSVLFWAPFVLFKTSHTNQKYRTISILIEMRSSLHTMLTIAYRHQIGIL